MEANRYEIRIHNRDLSEWKYPTLENGDEKIIAYVHVVFSVFCGERLCDCRECLPPGAGP